MGETEQIVGRRVFVLPLRVHGAMAWVLLAFLTSIHRPENRNGEDC